VPNHHTRRILAAPAAFLLLAVMHTWPLAADLSHWSRIDNGDGALNIWTVSWVAQHLAHDPARLFEGNIFHPEHLTVAFSEAMLVQGAIAIPVRELGGSPVLAYNVALLAGFTLTGLAFCLLVQKWTGSWTAGYVAGSMAAFNAHILVRLAHLQAQHPEFIALMLFALDRLIADRRWRDAWWLAAGFVLQALTSVYLLVFSAWMLTFGVAGRAADWIRRDAAGLLARLAAAGLLAAILLLPYLLPYYLVHETMGFTRGADEEAPGELVHYLATGSRLHYTAWSRTFAERSTSYAFPGVMGAVLVIAAFGMREHWRDRRLLMTAAAAAGCFAVSFAPKLPFYAALHAAIPFFQAVRQLSHISHVVLVLLAVIAGFAVAGLQRRWGHARAWPAVAGMILLAVHAEAMRAPIPFTRFKGIPSAYESLVGERRAVVIEMPFPAPRRWFLNGPSMVYSTVHWHPLLNGYSGFRPRSYYESHQAADGFPSDASLAALYARGVTHIVVHHHDFIVACGAERFHAIAGQHSLQYVSSDEDTTVYRLLTP
jgi:hypothetical protein